MADSFDSLIQELQTKIDKLNKSEGNSSGSLLQLLSHAKLIDLTQSTPKPTSNSLELNEIIYAFVAQSDYTNNVLSIFPSSSATLEGLNSAINLVQLYFQGSKPLPQILSNLIDGIESLNPDPTNPKIIDINSIRKSVNNIITDRNNLQNSLNKVLREFSSGVDEQNLQQLVQKSINILDALKKPPVTFDKLSPLIKEFIDHLKEAQKIFRTFSQKVEDLTGNEPDEIQQLIRNWGDAIKQIEALEQGNKIKTEFNNDAKNSRVAIAQSIKIHELLEQNYDFLTTLVRSGDLESAGIL
ncbi:MAG: hypothetical protein V7L11_10690 [Nostoc sp.]|uniref:hypothetical protein n=1 Tax=Nostoc sp. TaxID=1180 RepID=UPI002FF98649